MIGRKSLLIVSSHFLIRFVGWIGLVIFARNWPGKTAPAALGSIAFTMSFLALFNIIADLGFSQAHIKRVSEGKDLGTCIGTYAAIKLLLTGLMVTITVVSIYIWATFFDEHFFDTTTESIIFIMLFYHIFLNLSQIAYYTFEGRKEVAKRQFMQLFEGMKTPFMILVGLAGASGILVGGDVVSFPSKVQWPEFLHPLQQFISEHALGSLAFTYMVATLSMYLIGMWLLRKYPIKRPSLELFKSYFKFALPTILFSVIGIISLNVDKIMINHFWSNIEVGYYFYAQQILQFIIILYLAVGVILFPTISEFHSKKQLSKIISTTRLAERYISMIIIPPIVITMVMVTPLISITISSAFLPASTALIILSVYTLIFSLNRPYATLINGMNRPGITTKIGFAICLVNIPLNLLFIPEWGLLSPLGINGPAGAALATALSVLVGFFGLRFAAKKLSGIRLMQTHTPRHIRAGAVMGVVIYFVAYGTNLFSEIYWYVLAFVSGLGFLAYLGVLYLLKEFDKKDLYFFLDLLRPKEMVKYISSEMKDDPNKRK